MVAILVVIIIAVVGLVVVVMRGRKSDGDAGAADPASKSFSNPMYDRAGHELRADVGMAGDQAYADVPGAAGDGKGSVGYMDISPTPAAAAVQPAYMDVSPTQGAARIATNATYTDVPAAIQPAYMDVSPTRDAAGYDTARISTNVTGGYMVRSSLSHGARHVDSMQCM